MIQVKAWVNVQSEIKGMQIFRVKLKAAKLKQNLQRRVYTPMLEPCIKMIPFHLCLNKNLYITLPACVQRETDKGRGPLWSVTINDITVLYRCKLFRFFFKVTSKCPQFHSDANLGWEVSLELQYA